MHKATWLGLTAFLSLVSSPLASASEPPSIEDNETLVMRIIFDDCLGFIQKDITPFEGLSLSPITAQGRDMLPVRRRTNGEIRHLFSDRYVVTWGEDNESRYCMVLTSLPSDKPMMLGVKREGFLERLTKRADAVGMTENDLPAEFSPLHTTGWREPYDDGMSELRMVVMPAGGQDGQEMVDAGLIMVAADVYSPEG